MPSTPSVSLRGPCAGECSTYWVTASNKPLQIVSPANKDRPDSRQMFVAKCLSLLQKNVCVSMIDLVTLRHFNLYAELLALLGRSDPSFSPAPPPTYAVTCR